MNLKPIQIFFFSLIPLALVFIGVIGGSFHGSDSSLEVFPTAAPPRPPSTPPPGTTPSAVVLQLTAQNTAWSTRSLTAPPNASITVRMNNQDAGVVHNFAVYTNSTASQLIHRGELNTGPGTFDSTFTTPAPGAYFFRCDVHPDQMTGTFTVR